MAYRVIGMRDGRSVDVAAVDWMMAMCEAIRCLDIQVSGWVCEDRGDRVRVTDPVSGNAWTVVDCDLPSAERVLEAVEVELETMRRRSQGTAGTPPVSGGLSVVPGIRPKTSGSEVRRPSTLQPSNTPIRDLEPPEDLADRLFELSMEVTDADSRSAACTEALRVVLSLVPCEAGSILRGTINDDALTFVAVSGPAARSLAGQRVRFGEGIVGAAYDLGVTIQVNDVRDDPRHAASFDRQTGFETRSVLCVPVRGAAHFYGAIELLNPRSGAFLPWHVEVVVSLAQALAIRLGGPE